jgi:hypothetical protein
MSDDNVRMTRAELVRWSLLAVLLLGALGAYFTFARQVPPAIPVLQQDRAAP